MATLVTRIMRSLSAAMVTAAMLVFNAPPADAMEGYRGRKRPVVIFSPSDSHPNFVRQKNAMNGNRIGVSDRDMVVIYVVGNSLSTDFGSSPRLSAAGMRSRYRVPESQFRVLLLGKDGDIKRDSLTAVPLPELFAEIDRMPMRRDEVRRRTER
jgi:hypothetical protein